MFFVFRNSICHFPFSFFSVFYVLNKMLFQICVLVMAVFLSSFSVTYFHKVVLRGFFYFSNTLLVISFSRFFSICPRGFQVAS